MCVDKYKCGTVMKRLFFKKMKKKKWWANHSLHFYSESCLNSIYFSQQILFLKKWKSYILLAIKTAFYSNYYGPTMVGALSENF